MEKIKKVFIAICCAFVLALLQILFAHKGYNNFCFINCFLLEIIIVFSVSYCAFFLLTQAVQFGGRDLLGTISGLLLVIAFAGALVVIPFVEVHYVFPNDGFRGFLIPITPDNIGSSFSAKANFPFFYCKTAKDASYVGLIIGGILGFLSFLIKIITVIIKDIKNN